MAINDASQSWSNGNKRRETIVKWWEQMTQVNRKAMATNDGRQSWSDGNKWRETIVKQWQQMTRDNHKTIATKDGRQSWSDGNKWRETIVKRWQQMTGDNREAMAENDTRQSWSDGNKWHKPILKRWQQMTRDNSEEMVANYMRQSWSNGNKGRETIVKQWRQWRETKVNGNKWREAIAKLTAKEGLQFVKLTFQWQQEKGRSARPAVHARKERKSDYVFRPLACDLQYLTGVLPAWSPIYLGVALLDCLLTLPTCAHLTASIPGCEMPVVRVGVSPGVHVQSGSPSSWPLVSPSPSLSRRHSSAFHWTHKHISR